MPAIDLQRSPNLGGKILKPPASKSISNRVLILNALSGKLSTISNLASARDTQLMKDLLETKSKTINAQDAGTTMRFLTAYFAITDQHKELTGTPRMKERPIGILVDALRRIGAYIEYKGVEGFPPLETGGFKEQQVGKVTLPGNVSSQYISALMMIAPTLSEGLIIELEGKVGSWPYIKMTASLMASFGVDCSLNESSIIIPSEDYHPTSIRVEPDWSAISYWLAAVALAEKAEITLKDVASLSIQGDRVIVEIMEKLGVQSRFENENVHFTKTENTTKHLVWDFTDCPDLAQTVIPVCALKKIQGTFTGLESLRIKETDRIAALQNELSKVGSKLEEKSRSTFELTPGAIPKEKIMINTYHDHRMAMGFASWATLIDLEIEELDVVNKSYPEFWDHMREVGFKTKT